MGVLDRVQRFKSDKEILEYLDVDGEFVLQSFQPIEEQLDYFVTP